MSWIREGSQTIRELETRRFALVWPGATTVSSGTDALYKDGTNVTSSGLTGAVAISGNVETTRTLTVQAGWGGATLVWEISAVVDGDLRTVGIQIEVLKPGQEM